MNEFLQNLRAKQNKRYEGNRRNYPNSQYQDRRGGKESRKQQNAISQAFETLSTAMSENLPVIKNLLEGISANHEKNVQVGERRARAEERKAAALEKLVEYVGSLTASGLNIPVSDAAVYQPQEEFPAQEKETAVDVAETESELEEEYAESPTRDDVLNMICGLREEGYTYDQIARQLEVEKVPTFSGKGQWRGQTVHRLYQKMNA